VKPGLTRFPGVSKGALQHTLSFSGLLFLAPSGNWTLLGSEILQRTPHW